MTGLSLYLSFAWSFYFPLAFVGLVGSLRPFQRIHTAPKKVQDYLVIVIPTVAREDTLPGLTRVLDSLHLYVPNRFSSYRIDVVVESHAREAMAPFAGTRTINILTVPDYYQPDCKHKGRVKHRQ